MRADVRSALHLIGMKCSADPRPLQRVLHAWPGYLAYIISFLTIGISWLLHTALTDQLARTDQLFLLLNLLLLLVVVFLPFPTRLVADALQRADISRERMSPCTGGSRS